MKKVETKSVLSFLIAFFLCPVWVGDLQAQAQDIEKVKTRLQTAFDELYEQSKFPGGSASIVLPSGETITVVAGMADQEEKTAMKPSDRLMSASIGKTYVAGMAVSLILDGKLSLDDKVAEHLGENEWYDKIPNGEDITVAHLMRHQSGLPRYVFARQVWTDALDNPDMEWETGSQLEYIYDRKPVHKAGEGWAYSDTNYILLGLILEKLAQKPMYDFVKEEFLEPNQLHDTIPNDRREMPGLIQGYSSIFKPLGMPEKTLEDGKFVFNPKMEWCGGGFLSTSADLAKWAHVYFSGSVIDGDYVDLLANDAVDCGRMLGRNSKYGLGVIVRESNLGQSLGHDGGFPGYTSTMCYYQDKKIAASLMVNTDAPNAFSKRAYQILNELVETAIQPELNKKDNE